ncbi:MAG: sensor histidine kinase KdpD [Desulfocapsaceae bacterium]|nr:sensor histidine kinase KdpD [Desulfocapsaceae bacterium]
MTDIDKDRPSPEAMLKLAQAEEEKAAKGKLKMFLGYAAGVGKTYSMLTVGRQLKKEGVDVVAAYVESHGRLETDALLDGLEVLPKAMIDYQGVLLPELDIDAVLQRRPQVALVDELAHSNAPGSRHEKRWQDVQEFLNAGIDVYTTVNVQHFESLNDVVAQITGVVVRETVPDLLLDQAADIRLIDISPDELLQRLHEGKVYIPAQATQAIEKFFRPGNLIALRELALRHTAIRVDEQMRAYMETRAIPGPWQTRERLLVCVSGSPFSEKLMRITRRLANEMKAPWSAVYIETPGDDAFARENRERIWQELRLAENMGAEVATITGSSVADALVGYAVKHNITKIVVGKPNKSRLRELLRPPIVDQIIRKSGQIDVYVVSIGARERKDGPPQKARRSFSLRVYFEACALVIGASLACWGMASIFSPTNMAMVYLLAVVLAAVRLGSKPAIAVAFISVLVFDFFFVPPYYTFAVADTEYLLTFVGLFTVGVVISTLVARGKERTMVMQTREVQTASLYYISRDLAAAADMDAIMAAVHKNMGESLSAEPLFFSPEREHLRFIEHEGQEAPDLKEHAVAGWAFRNLQPAGRGTATLGSSKYLYLPLKTSANIMGVLGVKLADEAGYTSPQIRLLLDAFAGQTAMALERAHLAKQAEQAKILATRENLERALLNSISHDLRSPLASITGILSSLKEQETGLSELAKQELLTTASEEATRLNRFVTNLLNMTRLEAGVVKLRQEDCDVQDLISCALSQLDQQLRDRPARIDLPPDLPLVPMDMGLMTQVLVNLLENAVKFSPPGSEIDIKVRLDNVLLRIEIQDQGPGVQENELDRIFDKFYQVPIPEGRGGTGLGLSICKGIVEAHGGGIRARNHADRGFTVIVQLPRQGLPQEEGGGDEH